MPPDTLPFSCCSVSQEPSSPALHGLPATFRASCPLSGRPVSGRCEGRGKPPHTISTPAPSSQERTPQGNPPAVMGLPVSACQYFPGRVLGPEAQLVGTEAFPPRGDASLPLTAPAARRGGHLCTKPYPLAVAQACARCLFTVTAKVPRRLAACVMGQPQAPRWCWAPPWRPGAPSTVTARFLGRRSCPPYLVQYFFPASTSGGQAPGI